MTGMTLIETKTLVSAAANIEFVSIPQTFTDLYIVASIRTARAALSDDTSFRLNGDTGSNYRMTRLQGNGSTRFTDGSTSTLGNFGPSNGNNSTSNTFGNTCFYLANYTGSTMKTASVDVVTENNATEAVQSLIVSTYTPTAAISSILIFSFNSANLSIGTTISLYGVLKGSDGIVTTS